MIHIHVWSTDATHVEKTKKKTWCFETKRLRFDKKEKKKFAHRHGSFQCCCLEWPRQITNMFYGVKRLQLQYGSQVGMSPGQTHTHRKQFLIKSKSCTSFYKRHIFFMFCLFLKNHSRKSCVPLTFRQTNQIPASEVTMKGWWDFKKL